MIRPLQRRSGVAYAVNYRPTPNEGQTTATFHDRAEAETFHRIVTARWPLEPLVTRCGYDPDDDQDLNAWADAYRVSRRELGYAHRHGGLTDARADQLATRARLHPVDVWGWPWITTALTPGREDRSAA